MFLGTIKGEVLSANNFGLDARLSAKSLIKTRKNKIARTES